MAVMPLTTEFFPDLEEPGHGIKGKSEKLANVAFKLFQELAASNPELIELFRPPDAQ